MLFIQEIFIDMCAMGDTKMTQTHPARKGLTV